MKFVIYVSHVLVLFFRDLVYQQLKVAEHHRKQKKEAKKNPTTGRKIKDPGIPNSLPFKEEVRTCTAVKHAGWLHDCLTAVLMSGMMNVFLR